VVEAAEVEERLEPRSLDAGELLQLTLALGDLVSGRLELSTYPPRAR